MFYSAKRSLDHCLLTAQFTEFIGSPFNCWLKSKLRIAPSLFIRFNTRTTLQLEITKVHLAKLTTFLANEAV